MQINMSACMWEMVNPFPHMTILKQTTLNIFCQKIETLYNWRLIDSRDSTPFLTEFLSYISAASSPTHAFPGFLTFNWMDDLWLKEENIVAKEEIARFEQFLLLSLYMFSNSRLLQRRPKASIWENGLSDISIPTKSHNSIHDEVNAIIYNLTLIMIQITPMFFSVEFLFLYIYLLLNGCII